MSNVNDEKIMALRSQIKEKKDKLKNKKKFTPTTNCSLELDGVRYNLNVLTRDNLTLLLVKLNMYKMSVQDLKLDDYQISGYKIEDWMADIKLKMEIIIQRDEERKLLELENKLHTLLSNEKKVELEISDIESMLK